MKKLVFDTPWFLRWLYPPKTTYMSQRGVIWYRVYDNGDSVRCGYMKNLQLEYADRDEQFKQQLKKGLENE